MLDWHFDGSLMRSFYSQDGEAEISIPAMTEVVQDTFQQANINFVKGPPSATGIHQGNDRNSAFRDTKAGMAKVTRCGTDCTNPSLDANGRKVIYELNDNIH